MLQRVYRQLKTVSPEADITVATAKAQVSAIRNQLELSADVCVEPMRRDTFPAISLATAYLVDTKKIALTDYVVVCPVDPYVELDYFIAINNLYIQACTQNENIMLLGVKPTYPSEKYGYIIPEESANGVKRVIAFKEKPSEDIAKQYIAQGALWNCGVFVFRVEYMIDIIHQYMPFHTYHELYQNYDKLPKVSFDYAVVEKESNIACMEFDGEWSDVGTWNTLTEKISTKCIGNVHMDDSCENTNIINELSIPILALGVKNAVITASADGILVSDKAASSYMKPYVDAISHKAMFAEKSWGDLQILDETDNVITLRLALREGTSMSTHLHKNREELWIITHGNGIATINGSSLSVQKGMSIPIPRNSYHSIKAVTPMRLIEVQMGKDLGMQDKVKLVK